MRILHVWDTSLDAIGGEIISTAGAAFDSATYSRFKYGYMPPARGYATGLAALIADELFAATANHPVVIVSAPYKYVPTASHLIAEFLCQELSARAIERSFEPPRLIPFHKAVTGSDAYARGNHEERRAVTAGLGLHVDDELVRGNVVLVVDDIRITGSAECATAGYLEPLDPSVVWYLHAARLSDELAETHPHLEDELNQAAPHRLSDIVDWAYAGDFRLNTRVLRFILEQFAKDRAGFTYFLGSAPRALLNEVHQAGIGSGLAYYQEYQPAIEAVGRGLHTRRLQPQSFSGR